MLAERPKPDPETVKPQRLAAGLSALLLFVLWTGSALALMQLPASVAVHYNLQGRPDRYGSPLVMLLMPLLGTLMYFGFGRLARYPHRFNYPRQAGGRTSNSCTGAQC
jgi:hypothetical protein